MMMMMMMSDDDYDGVVDDDENNGVVWYGWTAAITSSLLHTYIHTYSNNEWKNAYVRTKKTSRASRCRHRSISGTCCRRLAARVSRIVTQRSTAENASALDTILYGDSM